MCAYVKAGNVCVLTGRLGSNCRLYEAKKYGLCLECNELC